MNNLFKRAAVAAAMASAGLMAQAADPIVLKVHHFLGQQSIKHTTMLRTWCDNISKDSGNRLQC